MIILAGAEYGSGSSRDWAAKGPMLLVHFIGHSALTYFICVYFVGLCNSGSFHYCF